MMTGILFGAPQRPESWEVPALYGVAVQGIVLFLAQRPGKDCRRDCG
jgi:hypothetical protein